MGGVESERERESEGILSCLVYKCSLCRPLTTSTPSLLDRVADPLQALISLARPTALSTAHIRLSFFPRKEYNKKT